MDFRGISHEYIVSASLLISRLGTWIRYGVQLGQMVKADGQPFARVRTNLTCSEQTSVSSMFPSALLFQEDQLSIPPRCLWPKGLASEHHMTNSD